MNFAPICFILLLIWGVNGIYYEKIRHLRYLQENGTIASSVDSVNSSALIEQAQYTCGVPDGAGGVRPLRVVTSSTDEYFPVFMNWLVYYHKICPTISNVYFICLDSIIEKKISQYGLSCSHVFHSAHGGPGVGEIWLVRTRLTHSLLSQGYDVLLTDSDALWLQSPFPLFTKFMGTSDVLASRGSFPDHISKAWGATVCMGFVYIKTSPHTVTLWNEIAQHMSHQANPDDQREVNGIFYNLKLKFDVKLTYLDSKKYDTGHFMYHNHNYGITLLPHVYFRRICDPEKLEDVKHSVVAHCLSHQKKGSSKRDTADMMDLWLLKKDWESVKLEHDMFAYLDAISVEGKGASIPPEYSVNSGVVRIKGVNNSSKNNSNHTSSPLNNNNNTLAEGSSDSTIQNNTPHKRSLLQSMSSLTSLTPHSPLHHPPRYQPQPRKRRWLLVRSESLNELNDHQQQHSDRLSSSSESASAPSAERPAVCYEYAAYRERLKEINNSTIPPPSPPSTHISSQLLSSDMCFYLTEHTPLSIISEYESWAHNNNN